MTDNRVKNDVNCRKNMTNLAVKKTRIRKSREDRIAEIIEAAADVFTREGYSELTLRRVAKDVGIRLSTVQYYFESKELLLASLLKTRIDRYRDDLAQFKVEAKGNSEQQLAAYIWFLINDSEKQTTCGFFTQLWAMGFQQDECRDLLTYMYDTHREDIATLVNAARPELDFLECLKRATIISSMIEGSLVHFGHGLPDKPEFEGVKDRMKDLIMKIALAPKVQEDTK